MIKRLISLGVSSLLICFFTGCSTIQFVQHEQDGTKKSINRWHHSTLSGTVEVSPPLNIQSICGDKAWTTVTTEFTLYNAFVTSLFAGPKFISYYSAWTNKVKCYELMQKGPN